MDERWLGLWAQGALTAAQFEELRLRGDDAETALRALWASEGARPRSWPPYTKVEDLLRWAEQGALLLRRALAAAKVPMRVIESASIDAGGRSPFVCIAGEQPPEIGKLGIVGTRRLEGADARLEGWLAPLVRQARGIISGGAYGTDACAHRVALEEGVPTWVVFAGGLEFVSPAGNRDIFVQALRDGGGWVSERPPWVQPRQHDFLERNRVIAGLSDALLVARAPMRSGALSTARFAEATGRPRWVLPGEPDDPIAEGCHAMVAQGARLASPRTDLRESLRLGEQPTLLLVDGGGVAASRVRPAASYSAAVRAQALRFSAWVADGAHGWIGDDASEHQELVLDLELQGLVEVDLTGALRWTSAGTALAKALASKPNAACSTPHDDGDSLRSSDFSG